MLELKRGAWGERGSWHGAVGVNDPWLHPGLMHYRTAIMCCPACGQDVSLSKHTVQEDGTVTPSVVCPTKEEQDRGHSFMCPCGFHENLKLIGWPEWRQELLTKEDPIYRDQGIA